MVRNRPSAVARVRKIRVMNMPTLPGKPNRPVVDQPIGVGWLINSPVIQPMPKASAIFKYLIVGPLWPPTRSLPARAPGDFSFSQNSGAIIEHKPEGSEAARSALPRRTLECHGRRTMAAVWL